METKQPLHKLRSGLLEITLWDNEIKKDDETFTKYSFNLKKSFQDNESNWKSQSIILDLKDIQRTMVLLEEMQKEFLLKNKSGENQEREEDLF